MQKNTIRVLIASLVINLIFIVALTGTTINIKNKNEQIKTLTLTNESLNQKVSKNDANSETKTLLNTQKIKDTISNFINAEFNYTNSNYISRSENIKKYVTYDVYSALKGTGDIETPKTKIQDEVTNLNVYLTTNDNKTIKALVNITTVYSVQGIKGKAINQIYELELTEPEQGKDTWIINKYTLMGNFSPYSTNQ
jgi:hypothetical protein